MADIIKDDVRTYVEELIKREFSTKNNEGKVLSVNRKTNTREPRHEQGRLRRMADLCKRSR
jgi:hypothetical protein